MVTDSDFSRWRKALDLDIQIFDAYMWGQTGEVHVPDLTDIAFLKRTNCTAFNKTVEAAVEKRITKGDWSASLHYDVYRHLRHRAWNASGLLTAVASFEEAIPIDVPRDENLRSPDSGDGAAFIRWLFLRLWDAGSSAYFESVTKFVDQSAAQNAAN